jgi:hypothetical protein
VRTAAQVAPDPVAGARVQVVVDRQLAAADLHDLGGVDVAFDVDEFQLERLCGQLLLRGVHRLDDAPREPLRALHDLLHPLFQRGQVVERERPVDLEVVVEAVLDRRADAELGLRELLLHGLRQHVRRRVPDDRAAVVGVGRDGLDLDVHLGHPGEVAEVAFGIADDHDRVRPLPG